MNTEQLEIYEKIETVQDRADFLLNIGVTARLDIDDPGLIYQAFVGDMGLPITAADKNIAIKKGEQWLKNKSIANTN